MPKKQTENSRYSSPFSPGKFVRGDQYLAELMCARIARQDNIELPDRFWKIKKWEMLLRKHYKHLKQLRDKFPIEAIIRAFNDTRSATIISFANKRLIPLIIEHNRNIQIRNKRPLQETEEYDILKKPRQASGVKSNIAKLKDFEKEHGC